MSNASREGSLLADSFSSLNFDRHKNVAQGKTIGHSRSGHPEMCPVRSITRRIIYLRLINTLPNTPLAKACNSNVSTFNLKT